MSIQQVIILIDHWIRILDFASRHPTYVFDIHPNTFVGVIKEVINGLTPAEKEMAIQYLRQQIGLQ